MADKKNEIQPIEAKFEDIVDAIAPRISGAAPLSGNNFNTLGGFSVEKAAPSVHLLPGCM